MTEDYLAQAAHLAEKLAYPLSISRLVCARQGLPFNEWI
jgi:hypothetical protein